MSRRPLSITQSLTLAALAAIAATACSDSHSIAPPAPSSRASAGPGSQGAVALDVTPSSIGWQEQARTLAAAANMSPLAAARVDAACGVRFRAAATTARRSEPSITIAVGSLAFDVLVSV